MSAEFQLVLVVLAAGCMYALAIVLERANAKTPKPEVVRILEQIGAALGSALERALTFVFGLFLVLILLTLSLSGFYVAFRILKRVWLALVDLGIADCPHAWLTLSSTV